MPDRLRHFGDDLWVAAGPVVDFYSFPYPTRETWLSNIVKKIRSGNDNNRIGAAFELLGLSLFCVPDQTVDPAREGQPGFDGAIRTRWRREVNSN
jgi:hypothetical protein